MRVKDTSICDAEILSWPDREALRQVPRGLREFPCIGLPSCTKGAAEDLLASVDHLSSAQALRKAVKHVAAQTNKDVSAGISRKQGVPYEQRRTEYQHALLQNHEHLRRLREFNLPSVPPAFSASRERKNKIALAVGKASKASVVATVGIASITSVALLASSPVTAVIGAVVGAVVAPFESKDNWFFNRNFNSTGPFSYIAASIAGAGTGATIGLTGPAQIVFEIACGSRKSPRSARSTVNRALTFFNYMPEAEHYANRPRPSTKEIADTAYDKLHDAFLNHGFCLPDDMAVLNTCLTDQTNTAPVHMNDSAVRDDVNTSYSSRSAIPAPADILSANIFLGANRSQGARARKNWRFSEREENAAAFNIFHRRLTSTAQYNHEAYRPLLITRMNNLVALMQQDSSLRSNCFQIAADSTSLNDDAVTAALESMEKETAAWAGKTSITRQSNPI